MECSESIIESIRFYYDIIYKWHEMNGQNTINKIVKFNMELDRDNSGLEKYKDALNMPIPEGASLDEMYTIAKKVQHGVLEWNYIEKVNEEIVLGDIANIIISKCMTLEKREQDEKMLDSVYNVSDLDVYNAHQYFSKAEEVYSHILLDNDNNIGGRVALIDTNWEVQKLSVKRDKVLFRKPSGLNLKEFEEENNLFQLVSDSKISIINISVL